MVLPRLVMRGIALDVLKQRTEHVRLDRIAEPEHRDVVAETEIECTSYLCGLVCRELRYPVRLEDQGVCVNFDEDVCVRCRRGRRRVRPAERTFRAEQPRTFRRRIFRGRGSDSSCSRASS